MQITILRRFGLLLALFVVINPVGHNRILIPVFFLLGCLCLLQVVFASDIVIVNPFFGFFFSVIWTGVFFTSLGFLNQHQGAKYGLISWVAGPAFYFLICLVITKRDIVHFVKLTPYLLIYVSLAIAQVASKSTTFLPYFENLDLLFLVQGPQNFATFSNGAVEVNYLGVSSLIPLLAVNYVFALSKSEGNILPNRQFCVISLSLGLIATFLSGRRAIQIIVLLLVIILPVLKVLLEFQFKRIRFASIMRLIFLLAFLGGLSQVLRLNPFEYYQRILSAFSSAGDGNLRIEMAKTMFAYFSENPILGHGIGTTIPDLVRDPLRPWSFELQYNLILVQMGIVGVGLLIIALSQFYLLIRGVLVHIDNFEDRQIILAASLASTSMLIANASNPYLQALGHQWVFFFPAIVASGLIKNHFGSS